MTVGVISKVLDEQIGERSVQAAIFTSYVFEPQFFELEVIPLLLKNENLAFNNDPLVKYYLVREALREQDLPVEVFYDAPMFAQNPDMTPQMGYLHHGIDLHGYAFHPKMIFLLVEENNGLQSLLVAAGSNNLTYAGWWDNIECQHWVEIKQHNTRRADLDYLRSCVNYLDEQVDTRLLPKTERRALHLVQDFLKIATGLNSAGLLNFYGPVDSSQKQLNFLQYLRNKVRLLDSDESWELEIISPFFADDADNHLHEEF